MWQLEVPVMAWSGSTVRNGLHKVYSLKDAVSGKFLRETEATKEEAEGAVEFADTDDTPLAHWKLKPLDEATTVFQFERTKFMLQNAETDRVLHLGEPVKMSGFDGAADEDGLEDESVQTPPGSSHSLLSPAHP